MLQAKSPFGRGPSRLPGLFCSTGSGDSDVGGSSPHNVCLLRSNGACGIQLYGTQQFRSSVSSLRSADATRSDLPRLWLLVDSKFRLRNDGPPDLLPS